MRSVDEVLDDLEQRALVSGQLQTFISGVLRVDVIYDPRTVRHHWRLNGLVCSREAAAAAVVAARTSAGHPFAARTP